ncbi:MAG: acyl carrier protein [Bacteroidota bacterium]
MTEQEKLVHAFADALMIEKEQVTDELKYQSIPNWDSISHMILITNLEDAYKISLSTDDVIGMSSVAIAKDIIGKHGISFS